MFLLKTHRIIPLRVQNIILQIFTCSNHTIFLQPGNPDGTFCIYFCIQTNTQIQYMTGQKAIEGCRRQDRICQKYIFDRWSEGMLMLCMRYVKNLPDAEELMLNGFYAFYRSIDRFVYSTDSSITAWLRQIMVNECLMFLRRKDALNIVEEKYAEERSTDESFTSKMSTDELFRMILSMPAGYSTVFNLYVVEGYTHKEIGAMLNISEGTSKSQLSKARNMLQTAVQKSRKE